MQNSLKILGIDPGTATTGFGVVEEKGGELSLVDCGALSTPPCTPVAERLHCLYLGLLEVIRRCRPDEIALEEPFVARNVRSALAVGRAQAVAMLAAATEGLSVYHYTPAQVKREVTNYGDSEKQQVQQMVRLQLSLAEPPQPDDAADALAIAICHIQVTRLAKLLAGDNSR